MTMPTAISDLGPGPSGKYSDQHIGVRAITVLQSVGLLPDGRPECAEGSTQDLRLGIDWTVQRHGGAGFGVAMHVSFRPDAGSFTLRYRTSAGNLSELTKRKRSVQEGGTYPAYTIQAYGDRITGVVHQAYVVRTKDLFDHCILPAPDEHRFRGCSCVSKVNRNPDGSEWVGVAVTEEARARYGIRGTLVGHGVDVGCLRPVTMGLGLGLVVGAVQ